MRAHHEIAVGDDVGRDAVDAKLFRFTSTCVKVVAEAILRDGRLHAVDIDAGARRDVPQDSHVGNVAPLVPVRLHEFLVHRLETTLLSGEFGRLQGGPRVDQPLVQPQGQPDGCG